MSTATAPARPAAPAQKAAAAEPRVRRQLNSYAVAFIWAAVGIISFLLFAGGLIAATWLVGTGDAELGAIAIVGLVGLCPIVGFTLAIINLFNRHVITGAIGLTLIAIGGLLFVLLFLAWGGTVGLFGLGWSGILVGTFGVLTVLSFIYAARAAR